MRFCGNFKALQLETKKVKGNFGTRVNEEHLHQPFSLQLVLKLLTNKFLS